MTDSRQEASADVALLTQQLEALKRQQTRSTEMLRDIISAYGERFRRAARSNKTDGDDDIRLSDRAETFPLGVTDQRFVLSESDAVRTLSATALSADAYETITLRLELEEEGTEGNVRIVQLIPGESKPLLESVPDNTNVAFKLRRIGGEPCLLRLETNAEQGHRIRNRPPAKGTLLKAMQLLHAGREDLAIEAALAQVNEVERPALSLLHATLAIDDDSAWLSHLNEYVTRFDIAPISLRAGDSPRFMRLDAKPPRSVATGPVVTVLMPAFNAERTLEFAATSILNQSWRPIELIIIDDCSTDATWQIAQRLAHTDSRVRAHRNKANVGPYVSKNLALSQAKGAYITCHDADDWAHPQRIEKQVEALLATDGRSPACIAGWLRFDESGRFTGVTRVGRQSDDGALQIAHVTCMLEADFMRKRVGYWDSVRFAADGEILERLELILGGNFLKLRQLAVLSLNSPQSLTNDPVHGISRGSGLSPVRRAYRDAWRQWHATLTPDGAHLPFSASRPFPAPDECKVSREALDLVRTATANSEVCRARNSL